jgi:hypothetical protein
VRQPEEPPTGIPSLLGENGYFVRPHVLRGAADALTGEPKKLTDAKAEVTANSLPADAFGKLSESARAADVHKQVVSKLDELLTAAGSKMTELVDELYSRSTNYKRNDQLLHDEQIKLGSSQQLKLG